MSYYIILDCYYVSCISFHQECNNVRACRFQVAGKISCILHIDVIPDGDGSGLQLLAWLVDLNVCVSGMPNGDKVAAVLSYHLGKHGRGNHHLLGPAQRDKEEGH